MGGDRAGYVPGDCRVRAILGDTDIEAHNQETYQRQNYTGPMTINEAWRYIKENTEMLGRIHDCIGLTLEDLFDAKIEFDESIQVRNV